MSKEDAELADIIWMTLRFEKYWSILMLMSLPSKGSLRKNKKLLSIKNKLIKRSLEIKKLCAQNVMMLLWANLDTLEFPISPSFKPKAR